MGGARLLLYMRHGDDLILTCLVIRRSRPEDITRLNLLGKFELRLAIHKNGHVVVLGRGDGLATEERDLDELEVVRCVVASVDNRLSDYETMLTGS